MTYREKPRWTPRQESFVQENFEKMPDEEIASVLGRSLKSVRRKRERMGFKKASGRGICAKYVAKTATQNEETKP